MQEIAALILAYAVLVDYRIEAATVGRRSLRRIADMAIPKRRQRSCPRALRQPVSSWPRLRKNTYRNGPVQHAVGQIYA